MVEAQEGDLSFIDQRRPGYVLNGDGAAESTDSATTPHSPVAVVVASRDGYIASINAATVGQVSVLLGAGRAVAGESVDPCAGILLHAKVGQYVLAGPMIAELFSNKQSRVIWQNAALRIDECIKYSDEAVVVPPIVSHRVTTEMGVEAFPMPALDF